MCGWGWGWGLNQDTVPFCSSQCSGKRSYKTVCQPMFLLLSLKSTCFLSVFLSHSLSLSLQPCILLHRLASLPDSQAHRFIQCISAPNLNNQLSYLDTVSLEHTDLRFVCMWTERTVQRDRVMSSLSKCTEVIGQDIRKPANPIQACLLTHTFVPKLQGKLFYLD